MHGSGVFFFLFSFFLTSLLLTTCWRREKPRLLSFSFRVLTDTSTYFFFFFFMHATSLHRTFSDAMARIMNAMRWDGVYVYVYGTWGG
ncbi:hypothetical protein FN846DRAFT_925769, partial [Sphaerosporella brunnea]